MPPWMRMLSSATCRKASEHAIFATDAAMGSSSVVGDFGGVHRGRARAFDEHEHVRAPVLDRLEAADRPAELDALLGVADGRVEATLRRADLFGGQRHDGEVRRAGQPLGRVAVGADQPGGRAVEPNPSDLAGAVEARERLALESRRPSACTANKRHAASVLAASQDDVCGVAVEHHGGIPVDAVTRRRRGARSGSPRSGSQASSWPLRISVAVDVPSTNDGTKSAIAAWSPLVEQCLSGHGTVEKNGEHSSAAPISSKTTASSDMPAPAPPHSSGTAMPCRPSSPAIWRHTASS